MRYIIRQSVILPATPGKLFEMYIDPVTHQAITGAPVVIGEKRGSEFRAFGGALTGTILEVIRPRRIIKAWRSINFLAEDPDSTLILSFTSDGNEGRIDLVHLDVPDQDYDGVDRGWDQYYWTPWRAYLANL